MTHQVADRDGAEPWMNYMSGKVKVGSIPMPLTNIFNKHLKHKTMKTKKGFYSTMNQMKDMLKDKIESNIESHKFWADRDEKIAKHHFEAQLKFRKMIAELNEMEFEHTKILSESIDVYKEYDKELEIKQG